MDYGSITMMLSEVRDGVPGANDRLFARVYEELKVMAMARMRGERGAARGPDTEMALDLVHDAHLRLAKEDFENRRHLFFAYARAMRQILVERARRKHAANAGQDASDQGEDRRINRREVVERAIETIHVHELLDRLVAQAPREHEIALLRYFGGMRDEDIAEVLGIDARTVRRDWASAKARLGG